MSNGKSLVKVEPQLPVAANDFYKTNGTVHVVMPGGPSLTRQEFALECDINELMKRYETAGSGVNWLPRPTDAQPFYADFSEIPTDLLGFMTMMQTAETAFMSLPASVRKEFANDPMGFVEFASDPENIDQMREWGLAPPKPPEVPPPDAVPGGPKEPKLQAAPAAAPPPGAAKAPGGPSTHGAT